MKFVKFFLSFIAVSMALAGCRQTPKTDAASGLLTGDLLFQDLDCGPLCEAIEAVTEGADGRDFSHVGIVVVRDGRVLVEEAIGAAVQEIPLTNFMQRSPKVLSARFRPEYRLLAERAANAAHQRLGIPYDEVFLPDNGKLYCSELLCEAFQEANDGQPFFRPEPMTFKDPRTGQFFPAWVDYYHDLKADIPEGRPGTNPGALSRDERLERRALIGNW